MPTAAPPVPVADPPHEENPPAPAARASVARGLAVYAAALLTCAALVVLTHELWRADLHVPLSYNGDGLLFQTLVKGVVDNGWYLHNDYLGMPAGMDLHDFPLADSLHFLLIRL